MLWSEQMPFCMPTYTSLSCIQTYVGYFYFIFLARTTVNYTLNLNKDIVITLFVVWKLNKINVKMQFVGNANVSTRKGSWIGFERMHLHSQQP